MAMKTRDKLADADALADMIKAHGLAEVLSMLAVKYCVLSHEQAQLSGEVSAYSTPVVDPIGQSIYRLAANISHADKVRPVQCQFVSTPGHTFIKD